MFPLTARAISAVRASAVHGLVQGRE